MTTAAGIPHPGAIAPSEAMARDTSQIEHYGQHCQEPTCNMSDFLPFKCGHCKKSYCSSHRLPFTHACGEYDASTADVRASLCQWCEQPLRVDNLQGRDTDINTAMEYHISSGQCPVTKNVGSGGLFKDEPANAQQPAKKKGSNQCRHPRCKNIMWVDIKCTSCGQRFCPSHREPRAHKCGEEQQDGKSGQAKPSNPSTSTFTKMANGLSNVPTSPKTSMLSSNPSTKGPSMFRKPSTQTSPTISSKPFAKLSLKTSKDKDSAAELNKTPSIVTAIKGKTTNNVSDMSASRRAAREREQAALALQNRAKKGLLTEDEKVKYATLQAMQAKSGDAGKSKDCTIS